MDKNFSSKVVNFLKKEGFYVILFVCLCVVAVVAVVTVKDNKHSNSSAVQQSSVSNNDKLSSQAANSEGKSSLNYDNALQVKKAAKPQNGSPKDNSQSVSKSVKTSFTKPVSGTLARGYSENPVYWDSTASYRPNLGYDIKCDLGTPVMTAMDGKVEKINTASQDGVEVIINHQNGLKTVYSNLDSRVKVTEGQNVTAGTIIGAVGKTTLRSAYEKYGDHLHFAVLNGDNFVDPGKYVKY